MYWWENSKLHIITESFIYNKSSFDAKIINFID